MMGQYGFESKLLHGRITNAHSLEEYVISQGFLQLSDLGAIL